MQGRGMGWGAVRSGVRGMTRYIAQANEAGAWTGDKVIR